MFDLQNSDATSSDLLYFIITSHILLSLFEID